MSQINVNRIKDSNEGAPDFPSGVNVSGITSTVTLGVTNLNPTNVNVSGVVTATTLDGSLLTTGTPTLGLGVTINTSGLNISGVATAGIVSATTLYGDGTNLTGIALTITPLNYNPAVGGLIVGSGTGIGITFNQAVKAGSGNVTLSIANAGVGGTVVENFGVGNSVTYGHSDYGTTITITPTSSLDPKQTYHLSYPSGAFTNIGGDVSYAGTAYTFITVGGEVWMWGMNNKGQLGQNSTTQYSSPVQVPGNGWSSTLTISEEGTTSAIKTNGELWMWGDNSKGALGQNSIVQRSSPVQIPGTTWAYAAAAMGDPGASTFGIKTDGTLWTWGNNQFGYLGQNNTTLYSSPVQLPGTTWSHVEGSNQVTYGIKTDGTLWSWGSNTYGGLGLSQALPTKISSPTQVPGTTWAAVSSGNYGVIATKTDGTLWAWGSNTSGVLGQNSGTNAHRSSPVQIPGTTWPTTRDKLNNYSGSFAGAIKTDGTLWTWGRDDWGNLGHVSTGTSRSSPTQVGSDTTWKSVSMGAWDTLATKTDGTLWAFGTQGYGQLGVNNRTQYNSPVQALGANWNVVAQTRHSGASMAHKEV